MLYNMYITIFYRMMLYHDVVNIMTQYHCNFPTANITYCNHQCHLSRHSSLLYHKTQDARRHQRQTSTKSAKVNK